MRREISWKKLAIEILIAYIFGVSALIIVAWITKDVLLIRLIATALGLSCIWSCFLSCKKEIR